MLGYDLSELLRIGMQDLIPEEDLEVEPIHFDELREGKTLVTQRSLRRKDGSLLPAEISAKMLPDGRLFAIVRDITERKKAEQALKQSRDTLKTLLEGLPDGISLTIDSRVVFANPAMAAMYGYTTEEFFGKVPADVLDPPELEKAIGRMQDLLQGGPAYASEYNCRRADGTLFPVEVTSRIIELDGSRALLSIHRDLTERKKARTERERLEREILEVSAREQQRIGQDLHDGLGQRLTGIAFLSKALAQKLAAQSSPEAETAAEIARLVNQTITEARHLARGLSPVALEVGGLKVALEELALNMERLFDVSCIVKAEDVLPVRDDGKARHLYYVAQEAVTNAVKHGHAEKVEIRLVNTEDECALTIRDDGIGFSNKVQTNEGMGLHIMRYRANMIHASFSIQPAPGGGAVVHLSVGR
jgi:PAS domain S-box-containing protein